MKVIDVLKNVNYSDVSGNVHSEVMGLTSNSEEVRKGYMFCAIKGTNFDGHGFIGSAIQKGATSILAEDMPEHVQKDVTYVKVKNTRENAPFIASNYYHNPSDDMTLVGVTGTNGKTTVTNLVDAIWKKENRKTGIIGTIENRYAGKISASSMTTPDSIELAKLLYDMKKSNVSNVCMEVSSHALDLNRVDGCSFDCAAFTNLSQDHLDYHASMDSYFNSKKKLFTQILKKSSKKNKFAVINADDHYGMELITETAGKKVIFSLVSDSTEVCSVSHKISRKGIEAELMVRGKKISISSNLIGAHNLYNILTAVAITSELGTSLSCIESAISENITIPGRLEKITSSSGFEIYIDYAHTPDALQNVLKTLQSLKKTRIITVVGCGGDRDEDKRGLMGQIACQLSDYVILTSDNPRSEDPEKIIDEIENGIKSLTPARNNYMKVPDREKAIKKSIELAGKNDIVLIAGKGHENYQIIGNKKFNFDDREIAKKILSGL